MLVYHGTHGLSHGAACFQMQQLLPSEHAMCPACGFKQILCTLLCVRCGHIQLGGQTVFAQSINFLHAIALTHHQITLHKQLFNRPTCRPCIPPATTLVAGFFIHMSQTYAALIFGSGQDFSHQISIASAEVSAVACTHRLHLWQCKAVITNR